MDGIMNHEEIKNYDLLVVEDMEGMQHCFLCKAHEATSGDIVFVNTDMYRVVIRAWIGGGNDMVDAARSAKIEEVTEVFTSAWKRNS